MNKTWYAKKWLTVLIHSAAWVLLFSLPYLLRPSYNADAPPKPDQDEHDRINFILARINDVILVGFFYLNALVLIPSLMYRKKYAAYTGAILACFAVVLFSGFLLRLNFGPTDAHFTFRKQLFFSTFIFIFILACSSAYKTIRDKILSDNLAKEKENEFLKTELSLLRSQVSPHFMFNVLNNMVALARKQSDQLEPSLIKLSSLMRYMLYETGEEKVSLEKETEYLQSYIDLQRQRFGKKVAINVNLCPGDRPYDIEPMLLIPFVENAFKHGTGLIEDAAIDIELKGEQDKLYFTVRNKYNPASSEIKDKASGIGLANVQRRLELLYHHHHELLITRNDCCFTVSLKINLAA
ncbi:MAG: histidine kinase [Bacteroidota bacterium]|nr:histidine kinase [Ferruginibacter sp.]